MDDDTPGKAPHKPPPDSSTEKTSPSSSSSLTDRIQSSASGLFRGAGDEVSATLAASLAGKADGGGGGGGSLSTQHAPPASSSIARGGAGKGKGKGAAVGDTFRSTNETNTKAEAETDLERFAAATAAAGEEGQVFEEEGWKGKQKAEEKNGDTQIQQHFTTTTATTNSSLFEHAWESTTTRNNDNNNTSTLTDGVAVSFLLSDPSFQPLSHPVDDPNELDPDVDTQPNPFIPPPPPQPPSASPTQDTNTNANTDQISRLALIPGLDTPPVSSAEDIAAAVLPPPIQTSEVELDWLSLDALYHDAVYGNYLAPYVQAAAQEVREYDEHGIKDEQEGSGGGEGRLEALRQGKAVRRLRMVLGHVRREVEMDREKGGERVR